MPTKDEVREFLIKQAPGKPEIRELLNSFLMGWGDDVYMSIYSLNDKGIRIRNSMAGRGIDQAREFSTLYLSVVEFADKVQEFLTTS